MTKILRQLFAHPQPCTHRGRLAMTSTHRFGRVICDACGWVRSEWRYA